MFRLVVVNMAVRGRLPECVRRKLSKVFWEGYRSCLGKLGYRRCSGKGTKCVLGKGTEGVAITVVRGVLSKVFQSGARVDEQRANMRKLIS